MDRFLKQDHQRYLAKMALYVGFLYFLLPCVIGFVGPFATIDGESVSSDVFPRTAHLIATGGASFLLAYLPSLFLFRRRLLRRIYELSLFPLVVICTVAQFIVFQEFGTEINERVLGMFQGNFSALWIHAQVHYKIEWAITAMVLISALLAYALRRWEGPKRTFTLPFLMSFLFLVGGSAAVSLGLDHSARGSAPYESAKWSAAPVFQTAVFTGEQLFRKRPSGLKGFLEKGGPIEEETVAEELACRLGEPIASFLRVQIETPTWLKRRPSHIFLFVMESKDAAFAFDPSLRSLTPRLQEFAETGISVAHFYAASSATVDAIQSGQAGVGRQANYPHSRVLARLKLDTLPGIAKRANYSAHFYAASYRQFGNKGDSSEALGYDTFVGLPDLHPELAGNEWGVHDGPFFDWVLNKVEKATTPQLLTLLNVSYHPPYNVPREELGSASHIEKEISDRFFGKTEEERMRYASHVKYADREIGEAVDSLRDRFQNALFVFVGDHGGAKLRGEDNNHVPFILWNDRIVDSRVDTTGWFGSHMDLPATLASLLLSDGDQILTLGRPVWLQDENRVSLAGGNNLNPRGIWDEEGVLQTPFRDLSASTPAPQINLRKVSAIHSLSWGFLNDEVSLLSLELALEGHSKKDSRLAAQLP